MPSMQLAVEDPGANSSNCGEGYSCAYTNSISWSTPSTPLPMELNPQVTFERMFGDGSTAEERAARREQDRSILDSLTGQPVAPAHEHQRRRPGAARRVRAGRARDRAAASDRQEGGHRRAGRTHRAGGRAGVVRRAHQAAVRPDGAGLPGRHHARGHAAVCPRPHLQELSRTSGVTVGFHGGSHHGEDPQRIDEYSKMNRYHVAMLAHFVEKLAKYAGRRRHAPRSFAGPVRHQHGELQSASSRGRRRTSSSAARAGSSRADAPCSTRPRRFRRAT